jgi:hypothetical protein
MKILSALLGLAVVLLLVAFFYEHNKTSELKSSLVALSKDRDSTHAELRKLNQQIVDLRNRPITSAVAAAPARADGAPSAAISAPALTEPVARAGVTVKAPAGWFHNGKKSEMYIVGVDSTQTWGGMPSAYVESRAASVEDGFGGMMQTTAAENYAGKRVRLSGWVKTENANEGGGHLWLRIDGEERGKMLGFDNMGNRAVKGNTDWQEASIVLDVPQGSAALAYGFFVSGGGKMWVNGQKIEEVGPDVPTTNMLDKKPVLPTTPRNLGFDPNRPK